MPERRTHPVSQCERVAGGPAYHANTLWGASPPVLDRLVMLPLAFPKRCGRTALSLSSPAFRYFKFFVTPERHDLDYAPKLCTSLRLGIHHPMQKCMSRPQHCAVQRSAHRAQHTSRSRQNCLQQHASRAQHPAHKLHLASCFLLPALVLITFSSARTPPVKWPPSKVKKK